MIDTTLDCCLHAYVGPSQMLSGGCVCSMCVVCVQSSRQQEGTWLRPPQVRQSTAVQRQAPSGCLWAPGCPPPAAGWGPAPAGLPMPPAAPEGTMQGPAGQATCEQSSAWYMWACTPRLMACAFRRRQDPTQVRRRHGCSVREQQEGLLGDQLVTECPARCQLATHAAGHVRQLLNVCRQRCAAAQAGWQGMGR